MKRYLLVEAQEFWHVYIEGFKADVPLDVVQPIGLVQLAAMIREKDSDAEIRIIDLRLYKKDYHGLEETVKEFNPEFVGFRVVSRDSLFANGIIKLFRTLLPKAVLTAGGPHVTAWMGKVMEEAPLDYAVFGEGEITLIDLLEHIETGGGFGEVQGLIYRDASSAIQVNEPRPFIQNLDILPLPAWDLVEHQKYFEFMWLPKVPVYLSARREVVSIFSSRACPFNCTFCHSIFGKKFRAQSPEKTVTEIEYLYKVFGIRQFDFRDDIFNFDKKRVHAICDLLIEKDLKIMMNFPNGLRGDMMDEALILKMKAAGMFQATYALETASPRLQKMIRKNINLERLREAIRFTSKQDVLIKLFVMLGFPTETKEELQMTCDFSLDPAVDFAIIHSVNPFEGTEMAETLKKEGVDIEKFRDKYDYQSLNFNVSSATLEDLRKTKEHLINDFFTDERFATMIRKLMLYMPRR
ncbi:MAG: radical SAM protein [Candidatus Eremiobacteraeota bacterium]|nr:radical SAM protein [Candidatus Eremiobacteraeota bacterium]